MNTGQPHATVCNTLLSLQTQGLQRLDAQLLLLHVLGRSQTERGWLVTHDTIALSTQQAAQLQTLAQRRQAGVPLAYLTGHKEFFGLDLLVDTRVLVPRPDTETLVDWALTLLHGTQRVLDLGTGSGAIALALKTSLPTLQVHATDLSTDALAVARANAERLQCDVSFSQGAWFGAVQDAKARFDLVVANPPYIADGDTHLAALTHEPLNALTSGHDGLNDIRQIIASAPCYLSDGGWLLLEHGYDQAIAVRQLLTGAGFVDVQSRRDLAGIERCSGARCMDCRAAGTNLREMNCPAS